MPAPVALGKPLAALQAGGFLLKGARWQEAPAAAAAATAAPLPAAAGAAALAHSGCHSQCWAPFDLPGAAAGARWSCQLACVRSCCVTGEEQVLPANTHRPHRPRRTARTYNQQPSNGSELLAGALTRPISRLHALPFSDRGLIKHSRLGAAGAN